MLVSSQPHLKMSAEVEVACPMMVCKVTDWHCASDASFDKTESFHEPSSHAQVEALNVNGLWHHKTPNLFCNARRCISSTAPFCKVYIHVQYNAIAAELGFKYHTSGACHAQVPRVCADSDKCDRSSNGCANPCMPSNQRIKRLPVERCAEMDKLAGR